MERESQAPIVLGRGGAAIKALGSAAREQIEEFLGRKVYLQLSVQVRGRGQRAACRVVVGGLGVGTTCRLMLARSTPHKPPLSPAALVMVDHVRACHVQVAPAWRQQSDKLKEYGYFDSLYVS